jgi:hypothetical protein
VPPKEAQDITLLPPPPPLDQPPLDQPPLNQTPLVLEASEPQKEPSDKSIVTTSIKIQDDNDAKQQQPVNQLEYTFLIQDDNDIKGLVLEYTFLGARHAMSCNNQKDIKGGILGLGLGSALDRVFELDPSLAVWGILQTLYKAKDDLFTDSSSTGTRRVFVSCLFRTWATAILLHGPNVKDLTLVVSPYLKEAGIGDGNMPKKFSEQMISLRVFFKILRHIKLTTGSEIFTSFASKITIEVPTSFTLVCSVNWEVDEGIIIPPEASTKTVVYDPVNPSTTSTIKQGRNDAFEKVRSFLTPSTTASKDDTSSTKKRYEFSNPLQVSETSEPFTDYVKRLHTIVRIENQKPQVKPQTIPVSSGASNTVFSCGTEKCSATISDPPPTAVDYLQKKDVVLFMRWVLLHGKLDERDTVIHFVSHSDTLNNFLDLYSGTSRYYKDKLNLKKQNTWVLEVKVKDLNRNGQIQITNCKVHSGKCQPRNNMKSTLSACELTCDYGFGIGETRLSKRDDQCMNRMRETTPAPVPVEETCEFKSIATQGGRRRRRTKGGQSKKKGLTKFLKKVLKIKHTQKNTSSST